VIALLQRVSKALIGVKPGDDQAAAARLLARMTQYRIFADNSDKMNLNVTQVGGELLLVPQFTLAADTAKGLRPGFSTAAPPEQGRRLFDYLVMLARQGALKVETGIFGAHMEVSLINDGPVTIWLES
jgi:D-aminoacyl-tRNA deacylase